jgi:hypothetical protein
VTYKSYLNAADSITRSRSGEADIDFTLRLAIDGGFSYNQFIEIDMTRELQRFELPPHDNYRQPRHGSIGVPRRLTPPGVPPLVVPCARAGHDDKSRTDVSKTDRDLP